MPVVSLNNEDFDAVCADLMQKVHRDSRPDLVIGIPTGGAFVAESMSRAARADVPVLELTCRRPSTRLKPKASMVRKMVARLPRPVLDRLRQAEHAMLTRKPAPPTQGYHFETGQLERIAAWIAGSERPPSLLVVDDAIDSGATLLQVTDMLRRMAPHGTTIRSAVVTVTTDRPLIRPDYAMFHKQLCRFPWSLDAR